MGYQIVDRRKDNARSKEGRRRRYPRVPLSVETYYESDERALIASSCNLNLRGVFVPTPAPDPVGRSAIVRLHLPGETRMMKVSTRVVWSNDDANAGPAGMGLRFEGLLPWQIKRIAAHLLNEVGWDAIPPSAPVHSPREIRE